MHIGPRYAERVSPDSRPLAPWRFDGTLRHYQADVLDRVDVDGGDPLHIVAPPGSGKTLLGLLLAVRRGSRALVLAPTVTIREQWADAAASLALSPEVVSQDAETLGDLTALTYQALSVLDAANPLAGLAQKRWQDELESEGRSDEASRIWLAELASTNPDAYRSGIARRSRRLRRRLVREDPEVLAAALHPNARALIDRLVQHGIDTIVLDECHHLLDHWALVVAALVARLRAAGRTPLLVGLTATLPSPDDAEEYDNYTSLLGEVDYEVPVPAVVREGNLAPYRDLVRFVEPTTVEVDFLRAHADGLQVLIRTTFAREPGLGFLVDALQPAPPPTPGPAWNELLPPPPESDEARDDRDTRLSVAFAADFAGAEASAAMLATVAPEHPLVALLPDVARRPPTSDEALRLLGRYALDRVLPDPSLAPMWERIRRALADFGYGLTDRGVRRTRDPVDTMLASSLAKDYAVCDILRVEHAELGGRLRALVVADFAQHGNRHGGLVGTAGALRTFDVMVADAGVRGIRPILVTGSRTHIATRDADLVVRELGDVLGVAVAAAPLVDRHEVSQVHAVGVGSAAMVRAASELLTRGVVQVVVGTRGLFGEGWDCPAVNTLIDLTAVATASAVQQLRGRTLRLDAAWPGKVAHNWTVTAVVPVGLALESAPDVARLRRKHARLWGLDRDDRDRVVRGLSGAMSSAQRAALSAVVRQDPDASVAALDELLDVTPRAVTYDDWRIGDEYTDDEGVSALVSRRRGAPVFRTTRRAARSLGAATVGVGAVAVIGTASASLAGVAPGIAAGVVLGAGAVWLGIPLVAAWRQSSTSSVEQLRTIALVVWHALHAAGRVRTAPGFVVVEEQSLGDRVEVSVTCRAASEVDQRRLADALGELFAPVRTPRFVLELDHGGRSRLVEAVLRRRDDADAEQFVAVPSVIGRRRADAEAFAALWNERVGPCVLHALDSPEALTIAARARRGGRALDAPAIREWWA